MAEEHHVVTVQIMDRDFQVKCPTDKTAELKESAQHLDKRMRDLREGGKVLGPERVAIITALNITNDLLEEQGKRRSYMDAMSQRIQRLRDKIENAIAA